MPGYGIPDDDDGVLPWRWASERLGAARRYWVSTVRPDGRPHAVPVWGVWHDDAFWFSSGGQSRKVRNLTTEPRCVVTTDHADEAVIIEGIAGEVPDAAEDSALQEAYREKYDEGLDPSLGPIFRVVPDVAFGFIDRDDRFRESATRWRFTAT
jgi:nitroimidazol reductase NimA-like FMN-containing flavoprotein (pyridoxamine 5'-phosphate oxidase superfamily)